MRIHPFEWCAEGLPADLLQPIDMEALKNADAMYGAGPDANDMSERICREFLGKLEIRTSLQPMEFETTNRSVVVPSPLRFCTDFYVEVENPGSVVDQINSLIFPKVPTTTQAGWLIHIFDDSEFDSQPDITELLASAYKPIDKEGLWIGFVATPPVSQ